MVVSVVIYLVLVTVASCIYILCYVVLFFIINVMTRTSFIP